MAKVSEQVAHPELVSGGETRLHDHVREAQPLSAPEPLRDLGAEIDELRAEIEKLKK